MQLLPRSLSSQPARHTMLAVTAIVHTETWATKILLLYYYYATWWGEPEGDLVLTDPHHVHADMNSAITL